MPNEKGKRRRFGAVRKLPSGRFQARYPDPVTGLLRPADRTFATRRDAEIELSKIEADIARKEWSDPDIGRVNFGEFAATWIAERDLAPKTAQLYEGLFRLHLAPTFGKSDLCDIKEAAVRTWRKARLDAGVGPVTVAKAYRLLRAILNTAVDDLLIRRNPCRIKGAGDEKSAERPVLSVEQVYALADAITPRYRALVLLAGFAGLRWGELAALRRTCLDLDVGTVRVRESVVELKDGSRVTKGPKSAAGARKVALPEAIIPDLRRHLEWFAEKDPEGLVFVGPKGAAVRRTTFTRPWRKAVTAARLAGVHFHDLRHAGNHLAATSGASLRELMTRMGHSTTRAALIYLHGTDERDKIIAAAVNERIEKARQTKKPGKRGHRRRRRRGDGPDASGTNLARGG
jgi:integrase